MQTNNHGALRGVRVLDVTHAVAGPFCSQVLADHGADVIKVEPIEGDFFRKVGPFRADDELRAYGGIFQAVNRNKRSIALNLKSPEGRQVFLDLVKNADVLVENFRAGVMDKIGLGYETLKAVRPSLVYTSVRGFGDRAGGESPFMDWPAFDIVAQAMGGWMGITGNDPEHPVKVGGGVGDTVPGLFAAFGTMTALWHARATGQGQYVDVAMTDSILALSELAVAHYSYTGVSPQPAGNSIPGFAPFGNLRTRDGVIVIAAAHDPQFRELARLIGRPELVTDPRFDSEAHRWENRAALQELLEAFTRTRTKAQLRELFGARVPFGPVQTAEDIFADPHFAARDMLPRVEQPGSAEPVAVPGVPVKLSGTPGGVRTRAPLLGEHTREILGEIGVPAARIQELVQAAAVGAR
jgi:crotonobetainyl-CoA:carnitine CoA-transferase CaiB-like acyl-CoA transferase